MAFKFLDNQLNADLLAQEETLSLVNTKLSGVINTNVINKIDISENVTINDVSCNLIQVRGNNLKQSINTIDGLQDISGCIPVYDARQDLYPDNDLNVNIRNQNIISTGSGTIDSNITRVVLASNHQDLSCNLVQDASCNVNLKQINNLTIGTYHGNVDLATQRVTLGNDQSTLSMASFPVQIKNDYIYSQQIDTYFANHSTSMSVTYNVSTNQQLLFFNVTSNTFGAFLLPQYSQPMYIKSSSAVDVSSNNGLHQVVVQYYDSSSNTLQIATPQLNGTTEVLIADDVWRIYDIFPLVVGSANFNQGNITVGDSGFSNIYPGIMLPKTSKFQKCNMFTPYGIVNNTQNRVDKIINFDYVHYALVNNNLSGTLEFRVYGRINAGPWYILKLFTVGFGESLNNEIKLNRIRIPANNNVLDVVFTYRNSTATALLETNFSCALHIE